VAPTASRILIDRGCGDRDLDARTVFANAHRVEVLHALAGFHPSDDVVLFGIPIGWDDETVRFAEDFFGLVTVQPLRVAETGLHGSHLREALRFRLWEF
jgi:hypothetical protein